MIIIFVSSIINSKSENKELISGLIMARMEAKSNIEYYRGLSELTGTSYVREIDRQLDLINRIDEIISELEKKK
ncbi:MAG: hypothetical protein LBT50_10875 [Prevotellaceae bacterium]|jgi:predicted DNA-binding transcriptional regulator|nr:hypothetical protein [Prevotellaceae bacterium]